MNPNTPIPLDPNPQSWNNDEINSLWQNALLAPPPTRSVYEDDWAAFKDGVQHAVIHALDLYSIEYTGNDKSFGATDQEIPRLFEGIEDHIERMFRRLYAQRKPVQPEPTPAPDFEPPKPLSLCVVCQTAIVCPEDGFDTCSGCANMI